MKEGDLLKTQSGLSIVVIETYPYGGALCEFPDGSTAHLSAKELSEMELQKDVVINE